MFSAVTDLSAESTSISPYNMRSGVIFNNDLLPSAGKTKRTQKGVVVARYLLLVAIVGFYSQQVTYGQVVNTTLIVTQEPTPPYPGDPCLFRVTSTVPLKSLSGKWMGKTIYFNQDKSKSFWYGIGGVSLKTAAGAPQVLSLSGVLGNGKPISETKAIKIGGTRIGGINYIPTSPKGVDLADAHDLALIQEDKEIKREVLSIITQTAGWNGSFVPPMNNSPGSPFGKRRKYSNGQVKVHEGLDYPAQLGTAIKAINSGKVILARKMVFEGNLVAIDHGQGLLSLYFHLSKFNVSAGTIVTKGQVIGECGDTGRVTGAHLHLAVRWQGIYVNPASLYKWDLTNLSAAVGTANAANTNKPVNSVVPSIQFSASASDVAKGQCANLVWKAANAATVKLNDKTVKASGREKVCPERDTTYTLTARNSAGSETKETVVVKVRQLQVLYDLLAAAPRAKWHSREPGSNKKKKLDFGGSKDMARGIVASRNAILLENNATLNSLLEIAPQQISGGQLEGEYKLPFKLSRGSKFIAQIGLAKNAKGSAYKLQLRFGDQLLKEITKSYTGTLLNWTVDLSGLADRKGTLILQVTRAGAAETGVYLLAPRIER